MKNEVYKGCIAIRRQYSKVFGVWQVKAYLVRTPTLNVFDNPWLDTMTALALLNGPYNRLSQRSHGAISGFAGALFWPCPVYILGAIVN